MPDRSEGREHSPNTASRTSPIFRPTPHGISIRVFRQVNFSHGGRERKRGEGGGEGRSIVCGWGCFERERERERCNSGMFGVEKHIPKQTKGKDKDRKKELSSKPPPPRLPPPTVSQPLHPMFRGFLETTRVRFQTTQTVYHTEMLAACFVPWGAGPGQVRLVEGGGGEEESVTCWLGEREG